MDLDQSRTRVAQAAIVFRQAADEGAVSSGERAEARLARLAPRKNRGGMQSPLWSGAVAGSMTAARFEKVDGAFYQLAVLEDIAHLALIILSQLLQDLPLTAGLAGRSNDVILGWRLLC